MTTPLQCTGIVLFAHGSRDPMWRLPIEAIAARIQADQPGVPVACAYLELCEPDLPSALNALVSAGAQRIRVLPVFFGMGKHAREDLPLLIEHWTAAHPCDPHRPAATRRRAPYPDSPVGAVGNHHTTLTPRPAEALL
jgi:sirohydrochlorin cobaltochelatase